MSAALAAVLLPWNAPAVSGSPPNHVSDSNLFFANGPEPMLVKALYELRQGNMQEAIALIDRLTATMPNFRLAQLVKGDLMSAKANQFNGFGSYAVYQTTSSASTPVVNDFRMEAQRRIERYLDKQIINELPADVWQLSSNQRYVMVVDTDRSRLFIYRNINGQPQYLADYYVTIGKNGSGKKKEGDKRTPVGVYTVSSKLNQKLPDLYGIGAFPISFPNTWDQRLGNQGHGIWLHGTPSDTYSRAPQASDGCVVMTNQDLQSIFNILNEGNVAMIIGSGLKWLSQSQTPPEKAELAKALEQWRADWQAQNTDVYLSHYSPQFLSGGMNYNQWAQEKRRIQAAKPKVNVMLDNISMLAYPGQAMPMVEVTFDQHFKSEVLDNTMRKKQYWVRDSSGWKIIYEGAV